MCMLELFAHTRDGPKTGLKWCFQTFPNDIDSTLESFFGSHVGIRCFCFHVYVLVVCAYTGRAKSRSERCLQNILSTMSKPNGCAFWEHAFRCMDKACFLRIVAPVCRVWFSASWVGLLFIPTVDIYNGS